MSNSTELVILFLSLRLYKKKKKNDQLFTSKSCVLRFAFGTFAISILILIVFAVQIKNEIGTYSPQKKKKKNLH